MLLSSSVIGASPLPAAVFAGLLWMQVISTAKVTELGSWVNLCKNVTLIELIERQDQGDKLKLIITTDGSKLSVETDTKEESDISPLPSLKQIIESGILHLDPRALESAPELCQEMFRREDIVVTMNEGSKLLLQPPPGATNMAIPKLAEIYQKREKAMSGGNRRIASLISSSKPLDPGQMIERLGTASMAMGMAVFITGGGLYVASDSPQNREKTGKPEET